jgi:hypothetical protein
LVAEQEHDRAGDVIWFANAAKREGPEALKPSFAPSLMASAFIPVFVDPGATTFTVIPEGPSSTA